MTRLMLAAVAAVLACSQTIDGPIVRANATQIDAPPLSFTRITVGRNGEPSNGHSSEPSMSSNGRFVAYTSRANNLVDGDTNGKIDVFVYDRGTGRTTRESVSSSGAEANELSVEVPANGTFYVRVHARNASGTGGPSNEIRVTVGSGQRLSSDGAATFVERP